MKTAQNFRSKTVVYQILCHFTDLYDKYSYSTTVKPYQSLCDTDTNHVLVPVTNDTAKYKYIR